MDSIVENAIREELEDYDWDLTKPDLEKMERLYFRDTITDANLKEVAKLQQLEELHLSYNKITDEGLKEMVKMKQLRVFECWRTKVTIAGVLYLKKELGCFVSLRPGGIY